MKIAATGTRGYEAKDFVDLYYLLKEMTIYKIVDNFKTKYGSENPLHYLRSMAYFDDVKPASWKSIKMITDRMDIKKIKECLKSNVADYENRMFKMNT
jgi:hypothetical protein